MGLLDRFNSILNRGLAFVAGFSLVAMVVVTVGEMVLRMFGRPMAGTVEVIFDGAVTPPTYAITARWTEAGENLDYGIVIPVRTN